MPKLVYQTTCNLCDRQGGKPWRVDEHGIEPPDPAAVARGEIPTEINSLSMKLLGHIQKAANWEQQQLTKAHKRHLENNGPAPDASQCRHLQAWQTFMELTALAQGFVIFGSFDTQDPQLVMMREAARLTLNTKTRKFFFTDQMLQDAVVKMGLDPEVQTNVLVLVQTIRDALTEQGKYAPDQDHKAVVLT